MIDYKYFNLFQYEKGSVDKEWKIECDGLEITDDELFEQRIEIAESLCSENELRFGSCEASTLKFKVGNVVKSLIGEWITVSVVIDHHTDEPLKVGVYKVTSDKPTSDKRHREVVAYDAMYDILNADVAAWYNSVLPNENSTMTLKQFREAFIAHFDLDEVVPSGGLVNDNITVQRTIQPEQISGRDVITAICEINGCFGHIGRDGKFHYIYLPQTIEGLYPADDLFPDHAPEWMVQAKTGHLYPQDPKTTRIGAGSYIKVDYEDFVTKPITRLQIRQEENDIGKVWPEAEPSENDNCYIIEDNFLAYGKSSDELSGIAQHAFDKMTDIVYRPYTADCPGNPCFEVGDPVRFLTKYEIVESYILKRTLKGIQALRDSFSADGVERYAEKVNGVHKSIVQLKGKTNVITRTVEENRVEMLDITNGLSNTITVTAKEIRAELKSTKEGLSNRIDINAAGITAEVTRAKGEEGKLSNRIKVNADGIAAEITRASAAEGNLSNRITVTADGLSAEITRASTAEVNLSTRITANAEGISTKVTKGTLSSEISQEAGQITLKSNRLIVESSQFALDENGNAYFSGSVYGAQGFFKGRVEATEGYFDSVEIRSSCTVAGQSITGTIANSVNWNGSAIGDGYLSGISGTKVGYGVGGGNVTAGINAGNITAGTLSADRLDVENIFKGHMIFADGINVSFNATIGGFCSVGGNFTLDGKRASWQTATIGGTTITYLGR